jgi:zinc/manganese transport system substrate-binding protein
MRRIHGFLALLALLPSLPAQKLRVVVTQPDLADLASTIGGDQVEVSCLTSARDDLHLVSIRPSMLNRVRKADLFAQIGLDLEHAWVPALLAAARNDRVLPGGAGHVEASRGLQPLGVPERVSRELGTDLHPRGNPHCNLDPEGGRLLARNIHAALVASRPDARAAFDQRLAAFEAELDRRMVAWKAVLAPHAGAAFIEDHDAWAYFAARFGLRIVGRLEPKPGLAPTAAHLAALVETARREQVGVILATPRLESAARKVAEGCGAELLIQPLSSALEGPTQGYLAFLDHVVTELARRLKP